MAETLVAPTNQQVTFKGKPMAKLDAAARKEIPAEEFGEPKERKYPMPDPGHAANAKARAKQMLKRGDISQAEYDKICAKADKVEGKSGGGDMGGKKPAPAKDGDADDYEEK